MSQTVEPFNLTPRALLDAIGEEKEGHKITALTVTVYTFLAGSVNSQDSTPAVWPSTRSTAEALHLARRTVQHEIQTLIEHGWLVEVPKDEWLPRWRHALGNRLQPVRVLSLPKHPKKQQQERAARRPRVQREQERRDKYRDRKRQFYEAALKQYLTTGNFDGYGGKDATMEMAVRMGKITDEASAEAWITHQLRDRRSAT